MLFTSVEFLFLFLPCVLAVYYALPFRWNLKNYFLLAASLGFYAWGEGEEVYAFNKLEEYRPDLYTVVKCVIPKGTRYYMSDPDRREHSDYPVHPITYCAEQMKAVAYYRNGKWMP